MALATLLAALTPTHQSFSPPFTCCLHSSTSSNSTTKTPQKLKKIPSFTRRSIATALVVIGGEAVLLLNPERGSCFDLRMTVPDQTLEEAESGIRGHAQGLLDVKDLIEAESWREAQKELRKNSAYLKQDIYTIIQAKPGGERPLLRKLYSQLFNSVTRLDYAARSQDAPRVWECYNNIVAALNDILSRV